MESDEGEIPQDRNVAPGRGPGEVDQSSPTDEKKEWFDLSEPREIKVKLPISLHIKLHSLKITKGRPISHVILDALNEYFERLEPK